MTEDASHVHVRTVVQRSCSTNLDRAIGEFNVIDSNGSTPLVLIPEGRCCLSFLLKIPSGVSAIVQRFGQDVGEYTPGLHFAPSWYEVAYLVTKQSCTYYYQVANCPTRDNVMLKVEITLVFRVLKAQQFVYSLGATKFDDALKAVAEEAIRAVVRAIKHNHVYELRGSGADVLLKALNAKFERFGVLFSNATIINVTLPQDLASALQNATTFDAKMRQQIRSQEFALKVLNDENDQALKTLHLENERAIASEVARKDRVKIELGTKQTEQERRKQLAIVKAQQDMSVLKIDTDTKLQTDVIGISADVELSIKRAQGDVQAQRITAEQAAATLRIESEAALVEAQNKAKAISLEADAEAKVYEQLQQKRSYDLRLAGVKAVQSLARSGKVVIGGESAKPFADILTSQTLPLLSSAEGKPGRKY